MVLSQTVAHHPELGSRFVWSVGVNSPGFLPVGDVFYAETFDVAKRVLRDDLETRLDFDSGLSRDEERELLDALDALDASDGPDFCTYAFGNAWWIDCLELTEQEWHELRATV